MRLASQHNYRKWQIYTTVAFILLFFVATASGASKSAGGGHNYLNGEKPAAKGGGWSLGSTGAIGYTNPKSHVNILVDKILKGSPADGKLKMRDVIIGIVSPVVKGKIGTGKFSMDARKALALAIEEAEKKDNGGKLVLKIWRPETKIVMWKNPRFSRRAPVPIAEIIKPVKAKTIEVTLMLSTMGTYSSASPWKCEKNKAIIDKTAQSIIKTGLNNDIQGYLQALGLLATGEDKYLPAVKEFVRGFAPKYKDLNVMKEGKGVGSWHGGYQNLLLTEYYLRTKDVEILPVVKTYARYLAQGVSGVGTWSHGMADVRTNGLFGPACAYGAMNQISLVIGMSLLLSQKCGVDDPYVDNAVRKSLDFYKYYVDTGCIPYGDHGPRIMFDSNGKMSIAAVFYDLAGRKREADYFTRMALASHNFREAGHSGYYFATQWGTLSASRGGSEAARAYMKSRRFFTELTRRHDGSSLYQPMQGGDNMKTGNWSTTGAQLLSHCIHRKAVHIAGKSGISVTPIAGEELKSLMEAHKFNPEKLSVEQLLKALEHYTVIVRNKAAAELGLRDEDVVERLIAKLNSSNRYARYGACQGLRYAGRASAKVFDILFSIINNDKDWVMRYYACTNLKGPDHRYKGTNTLGEIPKKMKEALLKFVISYDTKIDRTRKLEGVIAGLLFNKYGAYMNRNTPKLDDAPRELLIPVLKSMLSNPNGGVRSAASNALSGLTEKEIEDLWGVMHHAVKKDAPSGVMFTGGAQVTILNLMAKYHIKEGLELGFSYVFDKQGWGRKKRLYNGMKALVPYGMALEKRFSDFQKHNEKLLKEIKKKPAPKLKSIENHIKDYSKEVDAQGEGKL